MSVIVSAFPGVGKIYAKKSISKDVLKIVDLNNNSFKYKGGKKASTKEPNPNYPDNYIGMIKELMDSKEDAPDIIFVSTNSEIRNALQKANMKYFIIYPSTRDKDSFNERYKERGNSEKFCVNMYYNWDKFIDGIINETFPIHINTTSITEEMLKGLIAYDDVISESKRVAKGRRIDVIDTGKVNWSIVSRERRNWDEMDFSFKDYIDWDTACKFSKLPDNIVTNARFAKFINWKYLENNKSKYSLKTRKLISKMVSKS